MIAGRCTGLMLLAMVVACAPRLQPAGSDAVPPSFIGEAFIAADGQHLPLRRWLPPAGAQPFAAIVALHGFNDYANAFAMPGPWLAEQGVAVYAYDQRGFGAAPHPGLWAGSAAMIYDLAAVTRLVRDRHPTLPIYALGVSMGGSVILAALAGESLANAVDIDGVVLVAPAVWGRATMPFYQSAALWIAAHTVPWMKLTARGLEITPSDNIEMLRALGRDPLVIKETRVDAIWGLVDLMDEALAAAPALRGTSLILYGNNDEIIPANAAATMLAHLPPADAGERKIAVYDSGYHMLLRDLQGQAVWADIASWLRDPTAPLPSGADQRSLGSKSSDAELMQKR